MALLSNNMNVTVGVKLNQAQLQQTFDQIPKTKTVQIVLAGGSVKTLDTYHDAVKNIDITTQNLNNSNETLVKSMQTVSTGAQSIGQSFADTTVKVLKFGLSTKVIQAFAQAVSYAVQTVLDFDKALTEFKKVSELSGEELDAYTQKLGEMGKEVARTRTEMVSASTEFKKSGYSEKDSADLARIASLYQNIADAELSAGDASKFIISQMKAFNIESNNAIKIVDSVNEVSNKMAVSSTDISTALSKVSSALSALGNDYDESIALITSGTEIMQNQASKVGRGLRTIGNNIAKVATDAGELEIAVGDSTKTISLLDSETGDLLSTYKVFEQISQYWSQMTNEQRVNLGITLAGKNQFEVFEAVLTNFAGAQKAYALSIGSENSAMEENQKYMESLGAKLTNLKATFQELIMGDGGLHKFLELLISVATGVLKLVDALGGIVPLLIAISSGIAIIKAQQVGKFVVETFTNLKKIKTLLPTLVSNISQIGTATTLTATEITAAVASATMGISLIIMGISAIVTASKKAREEQKQRIQASREELKEYSNESKSLDELEKRINSEVKTRQDLIDIVSNSSNSNIKSMEDEISKMDDLNGARQAVIDKIEAEKKARAQITIQTNKTEYDEAVKSFTNTDDQVLRNKVSKATKTYLGHNYANSEYTNYYDALSHADGIVERIEVLSKYIDYIDSKKEQLENEGKLHDAHTFELLRKDLEDILQEEYDTYTANKEIIENYNDALTILGRTVSFVAPLISNLFGGGDDQTDEEQFIEDNAKVLGVTIEQMKQIKAISEEDGETRTFQQIAEDLGYVEESAENADGEMLKLADVAKSVGVKSKDMESALKYAGIQLNDLNNYAEHGYNSIEDYAKAIVRTWQATEGFANALSDMGNGISDMQKNYNTLAKAVDEYNSSGELTLDTINSLLQLDPQYLALLEEEGGQLQINETAFQNLANAQLDQYEAEAIATAQAKLEEIAQGNLKSTLDNVEQSSTNVSTAILEAGQDAVKSGQDASKGALGWQQFWIEMTNDANITNNTKEQIEATKEVEEELRNALTLAESARSRIGKYSKDVSSNTKKSADAVGDAMSDLKKKIKSQIEVIINEYDKQIDAVKKAKDAEIKAIEKKIKALEKEKDAQIKAVEAQIKALEKERDEIEKQYDAEIKALEKYRDQREKYWEEKIEQYQRANEAIEKNIELQKLEEQLALANQTKVKVFEDGKFSYQSDESAVSTAEQNLTDYEREITQEAYLQALEDARDRELEIIDERLEHLEEEKEAILANYDERIEKLEEYKDYLEEYYDEQISALEDYQDQLEEYYDNEIEMLEAQKEEWENYLENVEAQIERFINDGHMTQEQALAIYNTMYDDLCGFVAKYNSEAEKLEFPSFPSLPSFGTPSYASTGLASFASGTPSYAGGTGYAVVGENPYKEIVLGSKLNSNGTLMKLQKGSGVVNAKSTRTLAGVLNSLGELGSGKVSSLINGSMGSGVVQNFSFGNITLPNVTDANSFVTELSNKFNNYAIQYAHGV